MRWETVKEGRVPPETHAALAAQLRASYAHFPQHFAGRRSWSYVRPELRVVGWADGAPAASAGVLRRFVEVGGREVLVGIVGLVAVRPERQRSGLGLELMDIVGKALSDLGVPFGLLMCAPEHVAFYQRAGWLLLPPLPVRYSPDDTAQPEPVVERIDSETLVLPVRGGEWPTGDLDWNGASV